MAAAFAWHRGRLIAHRDGQWSGHLDRHPVPAMCSTVRAWLNATPFVLRAATWIDVRRLHVSGTTLLGQDAATGLSHR